MGKVLSRINWEEVKEYVQVSLFEVVIYLDMVIRFVLRGYPGKIIDWFEYHIYNFRMTMSYNSDDENVQGFCLDKEGYHIVGDTWSSRNRCNKKICVAHDTIQELRCPILPEHHQCKVNKGDLRDPYPQCCDRLECPLWVAPPPLVRSAKPIWWIHENYIHAFSSSSDEEELEPHPSTVSAKASGLAQPD